MRQFKVDQFKNLLPTTATFVFLLLFAATSNVQAQDEESDIFLGGGLSYGEKISELGLQFGGYYVYDEDFRFGGDFVYWLVDSPSGVSVNYLEFNGNVHYLFYQEDEITLYGIGSLGIHRISSSTETDMGDFSYSDTDLALGIGAGGEYSLDAIKIFAEPRLFLTGIDQFGITFGVRFGI